MIRATKFGPQEAFASPEWQRTGVAFVFPITLTRGPDQFMVYIGRDDQPWKGPIKDRSRPITMPRLTTRRRSDPRRIRQSAP